jgi:hypothetical protein
MIGATYTCWACGHPLPDDDHLITLTPIQQIVFSMVKRAGIRGVSLFDLIDEVYSSFGRHEPRTAEDTMRVHIALLNKKLETHGLAVRSHLRGDHRYRLKMFSPLSLDSSQKAPKVSKRKGVAISTTP